jgi:ligand-binding sensor domain-containing protein/signal transduction histidine kinase
MICSLKPLIVFLLPTIFIGLEVRGQFLEGSATNNATQRFTVEKGLSQSTVRSIHGDKEGFVWIGTQDGLNKFDGYSNFIYRHNEKDSTSISNNTVKVIFEDHRKRLWIGTFHGLNLLDKSTGRFRQYYHSAKQQQSISNDNILDIAEDRDGTLWIATNSGVTAFNYDQNTFRQYYFNVDSTGIGATTNRVNSLCVDIKGRIWVATEVCVHIIIPSTGEIKAVCPDDNREDALPTVRVRDIFQDSSGKMWFATAGMGVSMLISETPYSFKHYRKDQSKGLASNHINVITEDHDKMLWLGTTNGGVSSFDPKTESFEQIKSITDIDLQLTSINDLWIDGSNKVWMGSFISGVILFDMRKKEFKHYQYFDELMGRTRNNSVSVLREDQKKNIWIGTNGSGLYKFSTIDKTFKGYSKNNKDGNSLSSSIIQSLAIDKNGNVYAGTYGGGLNYLDVSSNKFTRFQNNIKDSSSIRINNVWSLLIDHSGILWIGQLGGFQSFDPKTKKFEDLRDWTRDKKEGNIPSVFSLLEDHQQNLWIGLRDAGLVWVTPQRKVANYFKKSISGDSTAIPGDQITSLFEDSKKRIWICSIGDGLFQYNPTSRLFSRPPNYKNLPTGLLSIAEDLDSNFWIGTYNGIVKYNIETGDISTFDTGDGLPSNEFNFGSSLRGSDGLMYFGCLNGLVVFDPRKIKPDTTNAKVTLTELDMHHKKVSINDETKILDKEINYIDQLVLKPQQNVFTIHFMALEYQLNKRNKYAYKLEGFDNAWNEVGTQRNATYTNLKHGTYVFRAKATNNDGVWSKYEKVVTIVVKPRWFEVLWVQLLSFILAVLIFTLAIRIRIKILLNQKRKLEEIVAERTKELNDERIKIETINRQLSDQNEEIIQINETVLEQNEELRSRNEEILVQGEHIEEKSAELELANKKIKIVNDELVLVNANLEKLVDERTSELKDTIRKLLETDEGLNTFLYRSSHDLRGPIASLLGLVHLLLRENRDNSIVEYLRMMDKTCGRMLQFLKRLNDVSIVFKSDVKYRLIDVNELIVYARQHLHDREMLHTVKFEVHNQILQPILTDPNIVLNILISLLENSVNFSKPVDPYVKLSLEMENNHFILVVADNGIGILDDLKDRIFDLFFRGSEISTGNGLGLYLVKKSVDLMKGMISVQSEFDVGTTIKISIPIQSSD